MCTQQIMKKYITITKRLFLYRKWEAYFSLLTWNNALIWFFAGIFLHLFVGPLLLRGVELLINNNNNTNRKRNVSQQFNAANFPWSHSHNVQVEILENFITLQNQPHKKCTNTQFIHRWKSNSFLFAIC